MKKCVVCKKEFEETNSQQKTCSKRCSRIHRLNIRRTYYANNINKIKKYYQEYNDDPENKKKQKARCKKWYKENRSYLNFYMKNIYPSKALKKLCENNDFNQKTFDALNKGGKTVDKRLQELGVNMK